MYLVSCIIPHAVHAKAGLRTKQRLLFTLCTNIFGCVSALSLLIFSSIKSSAWHIPSSFAGISLLFVVSVWLARNGKFALSAYCCSAGLFLFTTVFPFLLNTPFPIHILYYMFVC